VAVNGNTVYAVFERWNNVVEDSTNGFRYDSEVVVVRSDNGGADGFTALGAGGNGVAAGTPIAVFAPRIIGGVQEPTNTPLTLGQERTGSDLAIAVDPNNAAHVVTVWLDAPGANDAGILQLHLAESFDSGASWAEKFVTPAATRSDQPAVSISSTGAIGLLYNNYDPATNILSQHIVTTTNDFVTFTDQTLAAESNATPISEFNPYLGDFFDLTSVGNTFYGVFSASNADNGIEALFPNVVFGRNFTGNSGTSSFQLRDLDGNPVASSIDTYFFSYQLGDAFGKIFLQSDAGNAYWLMDQNARVGTGANLPFTGPTWDVKALVDYDKNGPDFSDLIWQNDNGAVAVWQLQGTTPVHQNNLGQNPGPTWHVQAAKDFDGNTVADVLLQNDNGALALWELKDTGAGPQILNQFNIGQNPGPTWHAVAAGDFNGDARAGILFFNDDGVSAAIWEMDPTGPAIGPNGVFSQQVNLSTGSSTWKPITAADFNADGKDDILWQNTNGAVAIWEMTGNGAGTTTAIKPNGQFNVDAFGIGPTWDIVAARDFDNDSKADLLWQNKDSGAVALWENFTEGPLGSFHASFTIQLNITPQPNPSGHLDWHIV
jgi:FG-GAP-like repeat